jgi:hypothetical protein
MSMGRRWAGAICDRYQLLVFSLALWNGKDALLKERALGLTPSESNHGEDVKDYYFYLDSTPTHSNMKYLYKYPQGRYPYEWLLKYPWFAAWDRAFHTVPFVLIDPEFAKEQLFLMLFEQFQHPNGQIPAYEWEFSDLNPPVHAWAVWRVLLPPIYQRIQSVSLLIQLRCGVSRIRSADTI